MIEPSLIINFQRHDPLSIFPRPLMHCMVKRTCDEWLAPHDGSIKLAQQCMPFESYLPKNNILHQ